MYHRSCKGFLLIKQSWHLSHTAIQHIYSWQSSNMWNYSLYTITVNSRKYAPPFLHTTFRQKWGGGVCSNIQFVSCIRPLPPFLVVLSTLAQIRQSRRLPRSFAECVTTGISAACIDIKPKGTEATCIVCGNGGRLRASPRSQCEQQKPKRWRGNEATVILCVRVYQLDRWWSKSKAH